MYPSIKRAAGLAAIAALAVPATAPAHDRAGKASVRDHARSAGAAVERVAEAVRTNDHASVAVAFAESRRQVRAAEREAGRLARRKPAAGAKALRVVAERHDTSAQTLTSLVADASGVSQIIVAKGAALSFEGRNTAIERLAEVAARVPARAQKGIARAVGAITAAGEEEVEAVTATLASAELPAEVRPWLELALGHVTAGIGMAMGQLESLAGSLPAAAQPHVQRALGQVSSALERVTSILQGILGGGGAGAAGPGSGAPVDVGSLPIPVGDLPIPVGKLPFIGR